MSTYGMPSDVIVDAVGDYAIYKLPRRRLGAVHWFGLLPIGFGLVVLAFLVWFFREFLAGDHWLFAAGAVAVALVFATPVLRMMRFGAILLFGRTEIRLEHGKLTARERAGPISWTRRRKQDAPVTSVSVGYGDGTATINGRPTEKFKKLASTAGLGVEAGPNKADRFLLTIGYPKEMLLPIGRDLAQRLHVEFYDGVMSGGDWATNLDEGSSAL